MSQKIRIKLKAYDHNLVDKSAEKIVKTVKGTGAVVSGPIPLPTQKKIFTVNRSTFVNKKAREQFELSTCKRILDIYSSTPKTIDALMKRGGVLRPSDDVTAAGFRPARPRLPQGQGPTRLFRSEFFNTIATLLQRAKAREGCPATFGSNGRSEWTRSQTIKPNDKNVRTNWKENRNDLGVQRRG